MKSTEVYAILREGLAPVLKPLGFKREKTFLSWSRMHDGQYTVVWCQVSRDGWDAHSGSQFVVEYQRSESPEVGAQSTTRKRINKLLTDSQRVEVQRLQNKILSGLSQPPESHPILKLSTEVSNWYLAKLKGNEEPYTITSDVWFRYASSEDVTAWAAFLAETIPQCVYYIENAANP